jgi:hypothetical protein
MIPFSAQLKITVLAAALSALLSSPLNAANRVALEPVEGDATSFGLPQMTVPYAEIPPTIDGRDDDAAWTAGLAGTFVHTITGGRAPVATTFRVAYDKDALYVYLRCVERGQESFAIGPSTRETPKVHSGDAAEIFLQPGGPGTPYFQLAANPWGGTMSYKWLGPGDAATWNPQNVQIAGFVHFDYWTLEVAIPFASLDLSTPAPNTEWRANFARNELPGQRLYGAWSATGDNFQNPSRFGRLVFLGRGTDAGTQTATVTGSLRNPDGSPTIDIPVRAFGRIERTDSLGTFTFSEVMPGEQVLSVISPSHETFNGRFVVKSTQLELEPVTLKPIDPYRPRYELQISKSGRWLSSSLEEPPDMETPPDQSAKIDALVMLATPREYESRAVAYLAGRDLPEPTVALTDLKGDVGTIPASALRVRWTQRLLKREHYQTSRDNSDYVWRFLWDEPPARVDAGQLRQLVVTAHIPEDAKPGEYRGYLEFKSRDKSVTRLPVTLRVASFSLAVPDKRVGTFINGFERFTDDWVELMLRDIRAHGGRNLKWWMSINIAKKNGELVPDPGPVAKNVLLQHRLGFEPPYTVGTQAEAIARRLGIPGGRHAPNPDSLRASDTYQRTYARFVDAARNMETELGVGPLTLFWSDEIFQAGRLEPWLYTAALTRERTDQDIFITHHSGDPDKVARIDPYADIRCYHGRHLDEDYTSGAEYDELARELEESGDEAWAYYNVVRTDITSEFSRIVNGYWLWRTPVSVHLPWTYFYGRRETMVGVREGAVEAPFFAFAAPHPTEMKMVSTLDWECFREGYDDLRYVTTLDRAIAAAPISRAAAARRAQDLLDKWWAQDPRVTSQAEELSAEDYQDRRRRMADLIEELID